jgi:4-amino-4-deoxy-L-arabinose transferase-like glycosyltransferase
VYPDELLYPFAGKLYLQGLASFDFSVLKVSPVHPPLSKLITGIFVSLVGPLGFSDIMALRLQTSIVSALTCVVMFAIGSKMDRRVGLLSWALLSLDPLSIRFVVASLDVTSLFFASLSIWTFLKTRQNSNRNYLFSGLFLGLAGLSKYMAFPIVLGAFTLIMIGERVPSRILLSRISLVTASAIVLLVIGNPLLWPPQLIGFSGYRVILGDTAGYSVKNPSGTDGLVLTALDWLEPALKTWGTRYSIFYLSMFAHGAFIYPLPIFQFSYLPWIFLAFLPLLARRKYEFGGLVHQSTVVFNWFSAALASSEVSS